MKGISKRVTIAFVSIIALLSAAGIIALLELNDMSNDTQSILAASRRNMERANVMLKSAHEHSIAVMHVVVFADNSYHNKIDEAMNNLGNSISVAISEASNPTRLDSLVASANTLREICDKRLTALNSPDTIIIINNPHSTTVVGDSHVQNIALQDDEISKYIEQQNSSENEGWYDNEYKACYDKLISNIEAYMTHTHSSLAPRAEQLIKNTHRSIAPVFITLIVMIAIMLMFYYFIKIYCVKPITRLNKSLSDYLVYRLPFNVKTELTDEFKELNDNIEILIAQARQNSKQP